MSRARLLRSGRFAAVVGAVSGAAIGLILLATIGLVEYANASYDEGSKVGFVARHAALGALVGFWGQRLWRNRSGGPSLSRLRKTLYGLGLIIALGLLVVPALLMEDRETQEARDYRAGMVAGCVDASGESNRAYCECAVSNLSSKLNRPTDESKELERKTTRAWETGTGFPPFLERAAGACQHRLKATPEIQKGQALLYRRSLVSSCVEEVGEENRRFCGCIFEELPSELTRPTPESQKMLAKLEQSPQIPPKVEKARAACEHFQR